MPQFRLILIASIFFTVTAVVMWGVTIAGIWDCINLRAMMVELGGASAASAIAAMCWLFRWHDNEERRLLIRCLGAMYQMIPECDRPPLLRSAR
jgi:hypothetical protein